MKVHDSANARVPSLKDTSDPRQISRREKALADEIRVERPGARQGDVFSPAAAKEIGLVVADDFNGRPVRDQKAILVEVPMKLPPAINTDYPTTLPLATVPPTLLEPLFLKYGMDVVFAGHEHFYERVTPQNGIHYFTCGGSAKLRKGNIQKGSELTEKGDDIENTFMVVEVAHDVFNFQTVSRGGVTIDSGAFNRSRKP
jgi:hypothetical protein